MADRGRDVWCAQAQRVQTERGVGHGLGHGVGHGLPCGLLYGRLYGLPVVRFLKPEHNISKTGTDRLAKNSIPHYNGILKTVTNTIGN